MKRFALFLMFLVVCTCFLWPGEKASADDNWAALTPELPYTYNGVTYDGVIAVPYYVYPEEFWTSFWYFNDSRENIPFSPSVSNFSIAWPYVVFRCQNSNPTNCTEPYLETSAGACLLLDPQFCFNTNDIKSSLDVISIADYDFGSSHCNLGNVTANQVLHNANLSIPNPEILLTIAINQQEGGIITSSPEGLICSGSTCQGSFPQGTSVTLTATQDNGWLFSYWNDGISNFIQNPLTVVMDSSKNITATFVWNSKITLEAAIFDSVPLGNRTPLILVHGNNSETEEQFRWKKYLNKIKKDIFFQGRYKVYLFSWDSEQSNFYNGMALGKMIDSLPEFADKSLTILAHSRGGLVARYFMNQYTMKSGNKEGQLGGEKVNWLVTLATPHRGSPGSDPIWVEVSFDYNFPFSIELALSTIYFTKPLLPFIPELYNQSFQQMLWDDVDNKLTGEDICYNPALNLEMEKCSPITSKTILSELGKFNQSERYSNKIIAYGGSNYSARINHEIMFMLYVSFPLIDPEKIILALSDHARLDLATVLMERMPMIPPGYDRVPDNPERPFKANDGMVPLTSALFLKPGASDLFKFNKRGNLSYDKDQLDTTFCQVAECHVTDGTADHLDFLDNGNIISSTMSKLKDLQ